MIINKKKKKRKKKRTCRIVDFVIPAENSGKRKERQVSGPCQRTKNAVEHEGDDGLLFQL